MERKACAAANTSSSTLSSTTRSPRLRAASSSPHRWRHLTGSRRMREPNRRQSEEEKLKEKTMQIALNYKMKQLDKKKTADPSDMTMSRFGYTSALLKRSDSGQCVPPPRSSFHP
jgi:hypothetical protein